MDEKVLSAMFEHSQQQNPGKMQFSDEEASRFKKAFSDPKFRELFSEYMDEIQDPKYREETEQYISQLEGEQKIPEGKELIR
jgi:dynein assembly factor 2